MILDWADARQIDLFIYDWADAIVNRKSKIIFTILDLRF
jgi:hypothetical protein